MRYVLASFAIVAMTGCASASPPMEFLTRSGCVQTNLMRSHLDEAITAIGKPIPYTVVDLDTIAATDGRKGYPTPTVLVGGKDLFDMPAPTPPFPEPT